MSKKLEALLKQKTIILVVLSVIITIIALQFKFLIPISIYIGVIFAISVMKQKKNVEITLTEQRVAIILGIAIFLLTMPSWVLKIGLYWLLVSILILYMFYIRGKIK